MPVVDAVLKATEGSSLDTSDPPKNSNGRAATGGTRPTAPGDRAKHGRQPARHFGKRVFCQNRHLLGFDSPRRALLTTVKEAVDNALDACEEAGILPEIWVHIERARLPTGSKSGCRTMGPGY